MVFDRWSNDLVFFRRQGASPGFLSAFLTGLTLLFCCNVKAFASGAVSLVIAATARSPIKTANAAGSSVPLILGPPKYRTTHQYKTRREIGEAEKQHPGSDAFLLLQFSGFNAPYIFEVAEGNIR